MNTVFILGAGASKAVWQFPTMDRFFEAEPESEDGDVLERFLKSYFGARNARNLEDVVTHLDNTLAGLGSLWYGDGNSERIEAERLRYCVLKAIRKRLSTEGKTPDYTGYDQVFDGFNHTDRIITFNYDLGVETYSCLPQKRARYLQQFRMTHLAEMLFSQQCAPLIGKKAPDDEPLILLKLHGSLNYLKCDCTACPSRANIFVRGPGDFLCPSCGADLEPVLVAPTMYKALEKYPKLALIWRIAQHAMAEADRLVLWGFSCPTTDHHFAWLMRGVFRSRKKPLWELAIIDPQHSEVAQRLRSIIGEKSARSWKYYYNHAEYGND